MSMLKSMATVGGLTMISRVLGFARDIIMASVLGAGWIADCFVMAFKLPNFFRRLFAEGAFNAAFVPLFSSILEGDGDKSVEVCRAEARKFAEEAMSFLLFVLLIFVALAEIFMPWLLMGPAFGFLKDPAKYDLAVLLTRITFPYLLFISLVSLLGGVLNALGKFAAVAATPIMLNAVLILSMLIGTKYVATPAHALSVGLSIAGVLQFVWLILAARRIGMTLRLRRPRLTPAVKKLLILILPAAIGAGAFQVNLLLDVFLASFLPDGSLSYLYYADRLNQLPIGVIGVAAGTALLPLLSRQIASGNVDGAIHSQNRAIEIVLFLTIPSALALAAISEPLIRVLFERNAFDASTTVATAAALSAYVVGLPAYVLTKVLGPGYYARHDTATPVRYAIIALVVNFVLNVALMIPLQHVGLALATAISAWVNVGLLAFGLARRGYYKPDARLIRKCSAMLVAALFMAASVWFAASQMQAYFHSTPLIRVAALAALVVSGVVIYGGLVVITGVMSWSDIKNFRRSKSRA